MAVEFEEEYMELDWADFLEMAIATFVEWVRVVLGEEQLVELVLVTVLVTVQEEKQVGYRPVEYLVRAAL